jgi:hypothetical protein
MDNTTTNTETVESATKPTDKEIVNSLIKQAKFAEDYYLKLVSQFEENLKKTLLKRF